MKLIMNDEKQELSNLSGLIGKPEWNGWNWDWAALTDRREMKGKKGRLITNCCLSPIYVHPNTPISSIPDHMQWIHFSLLLTSFDH